MAGTAPIKVDGREAVLRAIRRHAENLDRTKVGRDECQPVIQAVNERPESKKSSLVAMALSQGFRWRPPTRNK